MKSNATIETALQEELAIRAVPEVVIDWNMNRYVSATADNTPAELDNAFDPEIFPIESIIEPNRPTKGINKARIGQATISDDYALGGSPTPNGRFYMSDADDSYKYWTSPEPSDAVTAALANCKPQVVYAASTAVNKIVITLENTWASPSTFNIQTTTVADPGDGDWTTVANQTTTPAGWKGTGQIVLYWDGTDWQNSARSDNADKSPKTTSITGVRIVVTELEGGYQVTDDGSAVASTYSIYESGVYNTYNTDGTDSFFDLIEISARLEVDLSPYVISLETGGDLSEESNLYPLGTTITDNSSVILSNLYLSGGNWVPGLFNANNASSPYADYIDANAEVNIRYHYYDVDDNFLGTVQEAHLYVDDWTGQTEDEVEVNLSDFSKYFNETTVRAAMWEGLTVPEIIWRILDSIGFTNHRIETDVSTVTQFVIPVFYTTGEDTVWDVLDSLAAASQTAIYFDSYGYLRVKTREFALSPTDTAVWDFKAETTGAHLADIVYADQNEQFQPNHYTVTYKATNWSDYNRGQPSMQKVWEPDGDQVLRGNPLYRDFEIGDTLLYLTPKDAKLWPYSGIINIEGEIVKYEGKVFKYYTGTNGTTENTVTVKSQDEYNSYNEQTEWEWRSKNKFTGALAITERGAWNTDEADHFVDATGYSARNIINGNHNNNSGGFKHFKARSVVQLSNTKNIKDYNDILVVTRGNTIDTPFYYYGTKFKFVKGRPQQNAGLIIHSQGGSNEDGYYIEFTPARRIGGKESKNRHEMIVYSRSGGKDYRKGGKGASLPIAEGRWVEVDVTYNLVGADHKISIWVNGKNVFTETITSNKNTPNGKFGMFVRGKTKAEFEYLYAVADEDKKTYADDFSFMDKVERGYYGQQFAREWVFDWKSTSRKMRKKTNRTKYRVNGLFMDDFGPYAHEVREYEVSFDPAPVLHSRLYMTNDWAACALWYQSDPFGAKFVLANTDRQNTVINGEDTKSFSGTGASVNQVLTVFGRALVVEDDEEVIAKNDDQIRRRGKIESEISNDWIQSEEMAQALADWMNDNFSYGNESVSIEVHGNNLIELGDVVNVVYPDKHLNGDYFVVGVKNTFEQGLRTVLDLRQRI